MEVDRRSLMKGVLAGGAFLALGVPSWAFADRSPQKSKQCVLLLGGTSADGLFKSGARAACADMAYEGLRTVQLKEGVLTGTDTITGLLNQSRGARWITVLDDAGAVIFLELARSVGVRMLSMGVHACSTDGPSYIRHDLTSTSQDHSVGGLLASHVLQQSEDFCITEHFLREPPAEERALTSWGAPGFSSHRSAGPDPIHVHCSGCSLPDGRRLLGLEATEGWIPIPPQVCTRESVTWRSENWVVSVGYAITASALGVDTVPESCASRAFAHQSRNGRRAQRAERFVSFVMDI
ncbi:MAG: hypothetical protein H8K07_04570 [Nitrospira sp.]|jgi:hypothetical protein|nr:hypothetical protein [Nitrospira sp.]MDI3464560.1 hypothetical protein [Nitrospira sp.]